MFLRRLSRDSADDRGAPRAPHGAGGGAAERWGPGGVVGMKPVDFPAAWERVHEALVRLTSEPEASFESDQWLAIYTDIYRMCTYPYPFSSGPHSTPGMQRRLYDQLLEFLRAHSESVVRRMTEVASTASHMDFLVLYASLFRCYTAGMERGGKLLAYLDRFWVTEHHQKKGRDPIEGVIFISELVPLIWRQRVLLPEISHLLLRAFNQVVADLRAHPSEDLPQAHLDVMKAVVESYIVLGKTLEPQNPVGFYKEQLEDNLLDQVFRHYEERSSVFADQAATNHSMEEKTVAAYIHMVERCIRAEENIWITVHPSTAKGAVRVVRKSMLESAPHHEILMAFATHCLSFRNESLNDLQLLYHLLDNDDLNPLRGIDALRQHFLNYVKELGAREVKRVNDEARLKQSSPARPDLSVVMASPSLPSHYVSSDAIQMMLDLYSHYLNIVRVTLGEDARFNKAFKMACEHFINHLPNISESLAIHTHYFLDKNCPESRTEAIDVALDSIILLFNFIHDKDLFHRCYAKLLAHRIITFSSVSDEAEKRMMRHLRTVCGYQYAMTFQRMFLDKDLSEQLSGEFRRWQRERDRGTPLASPMDVEERGTPHHHNSHHPRRRSDSAIDFVETSDGRVTPRSTSPKINQGMRYIGLHDASPLQMMLAKRVFADKNKRYKTNDNGSTATGGNPSSAGSQASAGSAAGGRAFHSKYFFGEEDWEHMGSMPSGASGLISGGANDHLNEGGAEQPAVPELEFFAFVLTGGSWPFETSTTGLVLPPILARSVESFATFYDSKHRRRRLAWLHELGHGEVVARCFDRPYTLYVSTYQMAVLALLNRPIAWSVEAIITALDLDVEDMVTSIYPLIKGQVLTVTPAVTHISQITRSHVVDVNLSFSRRSSRLVFPRRSDETILPGGAVSPRSLDPGRMSPSLLNERKSAVEARVVYLMKHSTTMRHDKLVEGVLEHTKKLGFLPPLDFVCEIIRNDIEKDFIELIEDGPNPLYRYQA